MVDLNGRLTGARRCPAAYTRGRRIKTRLYPCIYGIQRLDCMDD